MEGAYITVDRPAVPLRHKGVWLTTRDRVSNQKIVRTNKRGGNVSDNLITNSDFEALNLGFESDYQFKSFGYNCIEHPFNYTIGPDASQINGDWTGIPYHGARFLIANGIWHREDLWRAVWRQKISLLAGERIGAYKFTAMLVSLHDKNPAEIELYIETGDGDRPLTLLASHLLDESAGLWVKFEHTFQPPAAQFVLSLRDKTCEWEGNDFGLDYLSLIPVQ